MILFNFLVIFLMGSMFMFKKMSFFSSYLFLKAIFITFLFVLGASKILSLGLVLSYMVLVDVLLMVFIYFLGY